MEQIPAYQLALLRDFRATHPYHYLEFEDWSWQYIRAGSGERALLLLPGAFVGAEMWFHLIMALQDRYRLLAPDMPSKSLTLEQVNAAFIKLLDTEGIGKATIVGYSAGGGLAQAFAQAHPERVEHLVLSHCTPLSSETARRVERLIRIVRLLPMPLIRAIFRGRSNDYPVTSEWMNFTRAFFAERIAALEKSSLIQFFESGVETAKTFKLAPQERICPMLLLSSKDDATTFKRLNEMQSRYPTAQTHVFDEGGHHTLLLFPEIYNSTIANFIDGMR